QRYLFKFDPWRAPPATRLTEEDTYNGQALESGFVYVLNTNNAFTLAVRPREPGLRTNLFVKGGLVNYTVAENRNDIFITAAEEMEPPGIWHYNVRERTLKQLVAGGRRGVAGARSMCPEAGRVKAPGWCE